MKAVTLTLLGLAALALVAFLLSGESGRRPEEATLTRQIGEAQPARVTRELEESSEAAPSTPVANALIPSKLADANERAPARASTAARTATSRPTRSLRVRFEDVVTGDDLGLFPMYVQRQEADDATLAMLLRRYPAGHLPESPEDEAGESVELEPAERPQLVTPSADGSLQLPAGVYCIGVVARPDVAFLHAAQADDNLWGSPVVLVGRAARVTFRGFALTELTVAIKDAAGAPVRGLELSASSYCEWSEFDVETEDADDKFTAIGPGLHRGFVYSGRVSLSGANGASQIRTDVVVPHGRHEFHAVVVAERVPYTSSLIVELNMELAAAGSHAELALTLVGQRDSRYERIEGGQRTFTNLRGGDYNLNVRELLPSGRAFGRQGKRVQLAEGATQRVVLSAPVPELPHLLGKLVGPTSGWVGVIPVAGELAQKAVASRKFYRGVKLPREFVLRLPAAGAYRLVWSAREHGGRRIDCGRFSVTAGQVIEQTFEPADVPIGSVRLEIESAHTDAVLFSITPVVVFDGPKPRRLKLAYVEGESAYLIEHLEDGLYTLSFEGDEAFKFDFERPAPRTIVIANGAIAHETVKLEPKR